MSALLLIFSKLAVFAQELTIESRDRGFSSVKVAYCSDCVPIQFQDEQGIPSGLIIDLWNLWSEKTGRPIELIPYEWDESLKKVGSGDADVHAGLLFNEERNKFLDYGQPLCRTNAHVFIHKSLPKITDLSELAAYRVGVLRDDYVEGFLKEKLPPESIVPYPNYEAIMVALNSGKLRVFAADTLSGIHHLYNVELENQYTIKPTQLLYTNQWFTAVAEGKQSLLEQINKGFDLVSSEERMQIIDKWIMAIP